jgi:hypothetical protein
MPVFAIRIDVVFALDHARAQKLLAAGADVN